MKTRSVDVMKKFFGRAFEQEQLNKIASAKEASMIVIYGRRRVGKTELIEQTLRTRNLLKFEGIEGLTQEKQLANVMEQLSIYLEEPLLAKTVIGSWREFFQVLAKYTGKGVWTIYLEELQWLASYGSNLVAELKYVWDNYFRHNPDLLIVLCGSAPTFMLDYVIHSKALYNRSQYEMHLAEFGLPDTREFLSKRSSREVMNAYLTVGGIPEYLKWVNKESSVLLGLCNNAFIAGSFFSREYEKIFTSSLANNKHYRRIIELLSDCRFATRDELAKKLGVQAGGSLTTTLVDLEKSGFITKYHPFNLERSTMLSRYAIDDNYLQFYFKFIKPIERDIAAGSYNQNPRSALNMDSYVKWLGFSFERFCRKYHRVIAKILGFGGVQYESGAFFSRATEKAVKGYQIDLIYDRLDNVYTICEIKYLQGKVGTSVIDEFERKLALFPNKSNKTIQKVLVCSEGVDQALEDRSYFDAIITLDQLLDARNW